MKETNELSAICVCTSLGSPLCCSFPGHRCSTELAHHPPCASTSHQSMTCVWEWYGLKLGGTVLHFLRGSTSQEMAWAKRKFVVSDYGGVGHIPDHLFSDAITNGFPWLHQTSLKFRQRWDARRSTRKSVQTPNLSYSTVFLVFFYRFFLWIRPSTHPAPMWASMEVSPAWG